LISPGDENLQQEFERNSLVARRVRGYEQYADEDLTAGLGDPQ